MQRKKDIPVKVGEGAQLSRQAEEAAVGWAGSGPLGVSQEPHRTPASSNVPAHWGWSWDPSCSRHTPQRPVGQRLPWVCPCPQQTRNQGLRCEQFTWKHNTRGRSAYRGGAIQGRGGTSVRGCRGAPSGGRGPLAAGWHHHRPPRVLAPLRSGSPGS